MRYPDSDDRPYFLFPVPDSAGHVFIALGKSDFYHHPWLDMAVEFDLHSSS